MFTFQHKIGGMKKQDSVTHTQWKKVANGNYPEETWMLDLLNKDSISKSAMLSMLKELKEIIHK